MKMSSSVLKDKNITSFAPLTCQSSTYITKCTVRSKNSWVTVLLRHRVTYIACHARRTGSSYMNQTAGLLFVAEGAELRTVCDNDVISRTITSTAIVTLDQGCVLRSKRSHHHFT
ncbi:hypothetical protein HF086_004895 [Spodoptera exigua]|uniref:Uncharacterized protein n=1 Tax=Spodoptera exigua TaxID=7107 RepID=A0A922SME3_SPOEX|nr:hypothetical protein HF086_004895 [Spodoptera exigua]